MDWACSTYGEGGRGEVYTGFCWGNPREGDQLEGAGVDGKILRWIFMKWDVGAWTGSSSFRIGTSGGHLGMR